MEEVVEIDTLEKSLLENNDEEEEEVLYAASFREMEKNFVKYQTVTRPVPFPCFGVLHKEKHVLLHSVADVVVEQGYLQSLFGVYSLRIENVGVRRPPSDDVKILGVANPNAFRKAVMMRLSNIRNEIVSRQVATLEDASHSGEMLLLQKLEEIGSSVKRMQTLLEEQQSQATESID
ncbi:hypothetical protein L195_g005383 [Trifolium pratense]|uniref:DUF7642 domain-containing protein n=1 Tax=Trifolium pratense TaxID=57577 RepID=A0A2K3P0L9_TRIPR|nr:hypothetical protein L195_g005383 [Trifolium pratense]